MSLHFLKFNTFIVIILMLIYLFSSLVVYWALKEINNPFWRITNRVSHHFTELKLIFLVIGYMTVIYVVVTSVGKGFELDGGAERVAN